MNTMAEYELFYKQTVSIMTLLTETVRDEVQKVFDCDCRPVLTDISCDRDAMLDMNENQRRLVPLFLFCMYFACYLIINKGLLSVMICHTACSWSFSYV